MTLAKKVIYTAKAHTTGGREGASRTDDSRLNVRLASPGSDGDGTNPEQLFAVGWSACFLSALQVVARKMKVVLPAATADDIEVDLCQSSDGYSLQARHSISLPGIDPELARALVEAAHQTCPYSKATHGNIDVETRIL
jgi:Ohr subfamily peroxiredoxin